MPPLRLPCPVSRLAGEIGVTLKRERSAEEYRETLRVLRDRIEGMTTLAEGLMLLVRADEQSGELRAREVALAGVVDDCCARLQSQAATRGITCRPEGLDGLGVYADPGLLARVIDNMLVNAVQYNRDGGQVSGRAVAITAHRRGRARAGPEPGHRAALRRHGAGPVVGGGRHGGRDWLAWTTSHLASAHARTG